MGTSRSSIAVTLARVRSDNGLLTKRISKNADGGLKKETGAQLVIGAVENIQLESFDEFAEVLSSLSHNEALTYGVSVRGSSRLMSSKRWQREGRPGGVVLRTREQFNWPRGGGILMLDYDPPPSGPCTKDQLLEALYEAIPQLRTAAHMWWPSASSCIYDTTSGDAVAGVCGQRVYVWVSEACEIPRIGELLAARLWLNGHGRCDISSAGSCLERTLVDGAVFQPERLDFAAGASCDAPLKQFRPRPERLGGFEPLNPRLLADPSESEIDEIKRLKGAAKARVAGPAAQARDTWIKARGRHLQACGLSEDAALDIARAAVEKHRLMGDFILTTREGTTVTVAEVLDNRAIWHGESFHDPLDEHCADERIAWAKLNSGLRPILYSHAHGGMQYDLCRNLVAVEIGEGGTATATEDVLKHMRSDGGYFRRGSSVTTVTAEGEIHLFSEHTLRHSLEKAIRFERYDHRKRGRRPVDCPSQIAQRVLDMGSSTGLPRLSGIITRPTMTPSGRVLERQGYDQETQLLVFNASGEPWFPIPEQPSHNQVLDALRLLWSPFALFPFEGEVSRGVFLSALFTSVCRRTLPTAPAFMMSAPAAGSGKTLLASCLVELSGGGAALALPDSDAEVAKVLTSVLRKGSPAMFFDNVTGVVDSSSMNAMLTSPEWEARILGVSEMTGPLPTNTLVVLSGNNARPVGDACRRMLVAYIDPKSETPYLREFEFDPMDRIRAYRMELVTAALTILRGWFSSGDESVGKGRLASFELWDQMIRQCVIWVGNLERESNVDKPIGLADPIAGIEAQFAGDEETEGLRSLFATWQLAQSFRPGGAAFAASELFRMLEDERRIPTHGDPLATDLGACLRSVAPKVQSAKGLGKWLKSVQGRIVGGLRVVGHQNRATNSTNWKVEKV